MSSASLDASLTRLENIKGNKQMYNKNKIAEAEALAAEALRMANEAKLAAARLAEVKKTLSMFSNKLEKAEQSVQKGEVKTVLVEKKAVADAPQEETPEKADAPAVEKQPEEEPAPVQEEAAPAKKEESAVVSKTLVNDDVVKVVEVKKPTKVVVEEPKEDPIAAVETPAPAVPVETPAPIVPATYKHDIVEDFLDHLGVDKMCGVDDETLGFTDRPAPPPPKEPEIFENPTKMVYQSLSNEEMLRDTSSQENLAAAQRKARALEAKTFQRTQVNTEFADPFGVDHDELLLCGKIADLCEPPEFDDDYIDDINDIKYQ